VKLRYPLFLALTVVPALACVAPASAQVLVPPYEISTSLRSMGLVPISPPIRRGTRYVVRAIDGRGAEVSVAADAWTGRVLAVRPLRHRFEPAPVYAERYYPPSSNYPPSSYYPEESVPPRGSYERQQPHAPGEPPVIYAPRDNADAAPPANANPAPQPPNRPVTAAKPPLPRVAARPPAKPPARPPLGAEANKPAAQVPTDAAAKPSAVEVKKPEAKAQADIATPETPADVATASTAAPPAEKQKDPAPPAENQKSSAASLPPVQTFE
jgi:hypothetical protein